MEEPFVMVQPSKPEATASPTHVIARGAEE